jgi:hypothetical protein
MTTARAVRAGRVVPHLRHFHKIALLLGVDPHPKLGALITGDESDE